MNTANEKLYETVYSMTTISSWLPKMAAMLHCEVR